MSVFVNEGSLPIEEMATGWVQETDRRNPQSIQTLNDDAAGLIDAGDLTEARKLINEVLSLAEQIRYAERKAYAYGNLGNYYFSQAQYDELFDELTGPFSEFSGTSRAANIGNLIATAYNRKSEYEKALRLYRESLSIAEDFEKARDYFESSLTMSEKMGVLPGTMFNQTGLGDIDYKQDLFREAIVHFEKALEAAEKLSNLDTTKGLLKRLYESYEKLGQESMVYPYLKRYSELNEELSETNREEALARQEALLNIRMERENRELAESKMAMQRNVIIAIVLLLAVIGLALVGFVWLTKKERRANRLLDEKRIELEKVNGEKDKIIYILSHDLRQPLTQLQGVVFLIQEGALKGDDLDEIMRQVDRQLSQGVTTLSNYLQWAQTQMDGIQPELKILDLTDIASEVADEMSDHAIEKQVELVADLNENTGALADPDMMRVILRNLFSNAFKFSDRGGKVIVQAETEGEKSKISVTDYGIGISEEAQSDIFKSFSKARKGTMGEVGTGLCLAICKDFAEKENGHIRCESVQGEWTRFTVTLPSAVLREKEHADQA